MIEASKTDEAGRRLRYGMIGGGEGAFIGDVHRKALNLDGAAALAAGCFSRDPANTRRTGAALGIDEGRLYSDFRVMAEKEAARPDRIDFAVIVTPNNTHYGIAKAFLEAGIDVVCDKPLSVSSAQAAELAALARSKGLLFCVTYTYTGYPMVKHAREMIMRGELGRIRFVSAQYRQEWLAQPIEADSKQAGWRTDPSQGGASNCVGDIGSHVENLAACVTGLEIESLCARLDTFVAGRRLDDNASIMINYKDGARGLYWTSQIAIGHDNDLTLSVYGEKGSLEWRQENPNYLKLAFLDRPAALLSRGRDALHPAAAAYNRIPGGHPEGYFEAFANIYKAFIAALRRKKAGQKLTQADIDFQTAENGLAGVRFIEKCVESSKQGAVWVKF